MSIKLPLLSFLLIHTSRYSLSKGQPHWTPVNTGLNMATAMRTILASFQPALSMQVYANLLDISRNKLEIMRNFSFLPLSSCFKVGLLSPAPYCQTWQVPVGSQSYSICLSCGFSSIIAREVCTKSLPAALSFRHGSDALGSRLVWIRGGGAGVHSEMGTDIPEGTIHLQEQAPEGFC